MKDQEKLPVMNRPLSLACDNLNDTFLLDERALRPLNILSCRLEAFVLKCWLSCWICSVLVVIVGGVLSLGMC